VHILRENVTKRERAWLEMVLGGGGAEIIKLNVLFFSRFISSSAGKVKLYNRTNVYSFLQIEWHWNKAK
jgi:hypothetical protein